MVLSLVWMCLAVACLCNQVPGPEEATEIMGEWNPSAGRTGERAGGVLPGEEEAPRRP